MKPMILLAEDDPSVQTATKLYLEKLGFRVDIVADGWKCIEAANKQRPDLILLDIGLPRLTGIAVLETMATHSLSREIPILMMTGKSDRRLVMKALQLGAVDFLVKPFDLKELKLRIDRALGVLKE